LRKQLKVIGVNLANGSEARLTPRS
jgi:hypothetical protein